MPKELDPIRGPICHEKGNHTVATISKLIRKGNQALSSQCFLRHLREFQLSSLLYTSLLHIYSCRKRSSKPIVQCPSDAQSISITNQSDIRIRHAVSSVYITYIMNSRVQYVPYLNANRLGLCKLCSLKYPRQLTAHVELWLNFDVDALFDAHNLLLRTF
jgi:hypothetical protein